MPKKFYTAKEAQVVMGVHPSKFYRLVNSGYIRSTPKPGSKQNVYEREHINTLAHELQQFRDVITEASEEATLTFRQATPEDMDGVYTVAHELFGHTTAASQRMPMIEKCPAGNYIVEYNREVVGFIHIQPLKPKRLDAFMKGEIRGWDLTADDLKCFEKGKQFDCLVKSIGATAKYGRDEQVKFARRLLRGTIRELTRMGQEGIIINKLYATSPYELGQKICESADMEEYSKPIGDRRTYVVDISKATGKPYKAYRSALREDH